MEAQSTYAYKARTATGEVSSGTMMAASAEEVSARLRAEGLFVYDIDESPMRVFVDLDPAQIKRNEAAKRIRREDVIAFCQQLAVMLETGVPLSEALDSFRRQTARAEFRQVLDVLSDNVESGEPLSAAMEKWPKVFPTLMISLMKASEASGTLAQMLGRVAEYLEKERRTVKQIKGALTYPIFMMVSGLAITIFLMSFVLPRFARIYESREASLPGPTKVLLSVSDFMTTQYAWYLPVLLVLVAGTFVWLRQAAGKRFMDWLRLHVPLIRMMYTHLYVTRATRTLATLLAAGVNVLDAIDICRGTTANVYYNELWDSMEQGVREGRQMSDAALKSPVIPSSVASMISAGERSGRLAEVMERIADFAQEELDGSVSRVTGFIEPFMIVFMGIVIGGVATALLLPIFNLGKMMTQ